VGRGWKSKISATSQVAYAFAAFHKGIPEASSGIYVRLGNGHGAGMNRRAIGHNTDISPKHLHKKQVVNGYNTEGIVAKIQLIILYYTKKHIYLVQYIINHL
jgi:hypothetical protein